MITQIYTIQTPEEALAMIAAGVDHIGTTPTSCGLPGEISFDTCKAIFEAVGDKAVKSALTVADDEQEIIDMITTLRPDIVHICGSRYYATPEFVKKAKELVPGIRVMQAIPVSGPESVEMAKKYAEFCDLLILDTNSENVPGIGAAGETHDWNLDKAIVDAVDIPIIIAGGLDPDNVADAIRFVKPGGVDSCTRTNLPKRPGEPEGKDIELCRKFCENAVAAAKELGL